MNNTNISVISYVNLGVSKFRMVWFVSEK